MSLLPKNARPRRHAGRRALPISMGCVSGQGCPSYRKTQGPAETSGPDAAAGRRALPISMGCVSGQGCPSYRKTQGPAETSGPDAAAGRRALPVSMNHRIGKAPYRDKDVPPTETRFSVSGQGCPSYRKIYRDKDVPPTYAQRTP